MTNNLLPVIIPFTVGLGLGAVNYAALWLTVQNIIHVKRPALLNMLSYAIRMGFILAVFYVVMGSHWERLIICFVGFFLVRTIVIRHVLLERKTV